MEFELSTVPQGLRQGFGNLFQGEASLRLKHDHLEAHHTSSFSQLLLRLTPKELEMKIKVKERCTGDQEIEPPIGGTSTLLGHPSQNGLSLRNLQDNAFGEVQSGCFRELKVRRGGLLSFPLCLVNHPILPGRTQAGSSDMWWDRITAIPEAEMGKALQASKTAWENELGISICITFLNLNF